MFPDSVHQIYGHVSPAEMELLYRLASRTAPQGVIVEIGSFQGKSTVCLGLGAKEISAKVYAIDPHEDEQINDTTHYGMENHAALLKNLVEFGVADVVRVIALPSLFAHRAWGHETIWRYDRDWVNDQPQIDLLWIDGSHEHKDVVNDLWSWRRSMSPNGRIALHDSSGHFPGVTQAMNEFLADGKFGKWQITQQVDATTVLERSDVT